jgi:hypothetical protein
MERIRQSPRSFITQRNKIIFYGELLAPRSNPNSEDHLLSAVRDSFNIFTAKVKGKKVKLSPCLTN